MLPLLLPPICNLSSRVPRVLKCPTPNSNSHFHNTFSPLLKCVPRCPGSSLKQFSEICWLHQLIFKLYNHATI